MVKSELLQKLCDTHPNILRKDMEKIITIILAEMTSSLKSGKNIEIRGFGTYKITKKKARIGRNPKTGEEAEISARKVVRFKSGKHFKKAVNDEDEN